MHKNSKFVIWNTFHNHLSSNHKVTPETIQLSEQVIEDLKTELGISDTNFSLGKSKILTYYNQSNTVFGNIRFNQRSIRIEPVFTGNTNFPYKEQADGYIVHSFLIEDIEAYQNKKETIFQLLKAAYSTL